MHKIIDVGHTRKCFAKNIFVIDVNNNLRLRSRRTNTMAAKKRKAAKRKPAAKKRKASKKRA